MSKSVSARARDISGWNIYGKSPKKEKISNKQKNNAPLKVEEEIKTHAHSNQFDQT